VDADRRQGRGPARAPLNHSWGIALHLTSRGLTTQPLTHGTRSFTIGFDFISHMLVIQSSDGNAAR